MMSDVTSTYSFLLRTRNVLSILNLILIGCSSPIEGLWIEKNERALLRFNKDLVISNTLPTYGIADTVPYQMTQDSIIWSEPDPEMNTEESNRSLRYELLGDTLRLWNDSTRAFVYFKSKAENYLDHYLAKIGLEIKLPTSENARRTIGQDLCLDIKLGFKSGEVKISVQDVEISPLALDKAIKIFKANHELEYPGNNEIICRLFIDKNVTCDYTFWLLDYLRVNDIRTISFITRTEEYNPYTSDFFGLTRSLLPKINFVEEQYETHQSKENRLENHQGGKRR